MMKWGRVAGLVFLVAGVLATVVMQWVMDRGGVVFRWGLIGPVFAGWGLGMVVVPGSPLTLAEVRQDWSRRTELFSGSRWFHVLFWFVAALVAALLASERLDLTLWSS